MNEYLTKLQELKALGEALIDNGEATREVYNMDEHLEIAINLVKEGK